MNHSYYKKKKKKYLELKKQNLNKKLSDRKLSGKEHEHIKREIDNYEYSLDLVEMNHYERGFSH